MNVSYYVDDADILGLDANNRDKNGQCRTLCAVKNDILRYTIKTHLGWSVLERKAPVASYVSFQILSV